MVYLIEGGHHVRVEPRLKDGHALEHDATLSRELANLPRGDR
jgi:hypothetical protein